MKKTFVCLAAAAATAAAVMSGCGSGNEPLAALGNPNTSYENSLAIPYTSSTGAVVSLSSFQPFVASAAGFDGFEFNSNFVASYNIVAPAAGLVTAADTTSVSITHNIHTSSRLSKLSTITVRVGDFVQTGNLIGTTNVTSGVTTALVHLTVLVDGAAVCPYGYFTDTAKTTVNNINNIARTTGTGPCNP